MIAASSRHALTSSQATHQTARSHTPLPGRRPAKTPVIPRRGFPFPEGRIAVQGRPRNTHPGRIVPSPYTLRHQATEEEDTEWPAQPARKITYFEPAPPRLARNTIIESTFDVGRRFRCTMRINCCDLDPGTVIRPIRGEWQPRMPDCLDEEELADWRAGRNAVYQLAALTIGARLAVADG